MGACCLVSSEARNVLMMAFTLYFLPRCDQDDGTATGQPFHLLQLLKVNMKLVKVSKSIVVAFQL